MKVQLGTFCILFALCTVSIAEDPRFGLYIVTNKTTDIERAEIAMQPLITEADIVSYDWTNHSFQLTEDAAKGMPTLRDLSSYGQSFIVMADGKRCYLAAFWTPVSSVGYPHPVILVSVPGTTTFQIDQGYPSGRVPSGLQDPRTNAAIRKVLLEAGKLKE